MDFLGTPDIGPLVFLGLAVASLVTSFIGVFTGAAGGVILLGLMAMVMPPLALIPVHTVIQLGSGVTRTMIMWRWVMTWTLLPFIVGAALGALAARTSSLMIGTSVLTPTFRYHPSIVAQAFGTLGAMAPGRVILGIGTGEGLNEVPSTGAPWPEFKERFARMREAVTLIRKL